MSLNLVQNEDSALSVDDLAEHFGKHERTIQGYIARGMPRESLTAADAWVADNIANNGPPTLRERSNGVGPTPRSLDEAEQRARIRKLTAEAQKVELKNGEAEGRLVDRETIGREVAEAMAIVCRRAEELPDHVSADFSSELRPKIWAIVDHKAHLFLHELSRALRSAIGQPLDDLVLEAAESIKRRRKAYATNHTTGSADEADGDGSDLRGNINGVGGQAESGISQRGPGDI